MNHWILFAGSGQAAMDYMRRSAKLSENLPIVLTFLAIAVFWAVLYFWDRIKLKMFGSSPKKKSLFDELCDAHELSPTERQFLIGAAEASNLSQKESVFVNPMYLQNAVAASTGDPLRTSLLEKLFGDATPS